uniref:TNF family profile domain-containing protein n=1 Tax=Xiphophorus couchianus TaxID=32473 RepID=A0A3B5L540_9TELE
MEGQCRSSQKYLLLHVWCGLLTMALVIMAAFIASIKPKSELSLVSASSHHVGSFLCEVASYNHNKPAMTLGIIMSHNAWREHVACASCSLCLHQDAIYVNSSSLESSLFFFYAHVAFRKNTTHNLPSSVMLIRNATKYPKKDERVLVAVPAAGESVWLGKMVTLTGGDSVRLRITREYLKGDSFWGAFQLH